MTYLIAKRSILSILLFFSSYLPLSAQQLVTSNEVMERMLNGETSFENLTISISFESISYDQIELDRGVTFTNCTFEYLVLENIISTGSMTFRDCKFLDGFGLTDFTSLQVSNCQFDRFEIINSSFAYDAVIEKSSFTPVMEASLLISNSVGPSLRIDSVSVHGLYVFDNQIDSYEFMNSKFKSIERVNPVLNDPVFLTHLHVQQEEIDRLDIINNVFHTPENDWKPTFLKLNTYAENLNLSNNRVEVEVDLRNLVVNNQFLIEENTFNKRLLLGKTTFSEVYNIVPFEQLQGNKISLVKEFGGNNPVYNDRRIEILNQDSINLSVAPDYLRLLRVYQNLLDIYKQSGDLNSWNLAYKEKKQLETKRLRYQYKEAPTFESFFKWRLNQFVLLFSDFGTNPAKAVKISFYIILMFSFVYFFFPSDWDKESKAQMLTLFKNKFSKGKEEQRSFLYLVKLLLLSIINSLTLSVNAFTTLGFGSIPTTGFTRYVAVFQGFIGWFLLSIFTVALINQVLF